MKRRRVLLLLAAAATAVCVLAQFHLVRLVPAPRAPFDVSPKHRPKPIAANPNSNRCSKSCAHAAEDEVVPLTLVTAASERFWGHLTNALGSFALFEPAAEIALYDLGLSPRQRAEASALCGVHVLDFFSLPGSPWPEHVRRLGNFAWKALVLRDAAERFGRVLYLDSGVELRRPAASLVGARVDADGYFCVGMGDSLTWGARPQQAAFFNETLETFLGRPMIAGGIHGVAYWKPAMGGVVDRAAACALSPECIAPERDPKRGETRSFGKDQPVFSMLAYLGTTAQCAIDHAFTRFEDKGALPVPETTISRQVMFIRRGKRPKPFAKYLVNSTDIHCPFYGKLLKNDRSWAALKDTPGFRRGVACECLRSAKSNQHSRYHEELSVITAANSEQFFSLENLIGSVHRWEPGLRVVVYDLGLTPPQASEAGKWQDVTMVSAGKRWRDLEDGAWRPLVLADAVASLNGNPILFLSPTHELRSTLEPLALQLYRDSVFSVTVEHDLMQHAGPGLSNALHIPQRDFELLEFKPLCSASVLGIHAASEDGKDFVKSVLEPLSRCASDASCWSLLAVAKQSTYSRDSVAFSALMYAAGLCYTCNRDTAYHAYGPMLKLPVNLRRNYTLEEHLLGPHQVIFNRDADAEEQPLPFTPFLKIKPS